jgi:hypothetical protein
MTRYVGLDVSQKMTDICVVDDAGRRLWRGQCPTVPEQITIFGPPACGGGGPHRDRDRSYDAMAGA